MALRGITRSGNGPELAAKTVRAWLRRIESKTVFVELSSPRENAYCGLSTSKAVGLEKADKFVLAMKAIAMVDRILGLLLTYPTSHGAIIRSAPCRRRVGSWAHSDDQVHSSSIARCLPPTFDGRRWSDSG